MPVKHSASKHHMDAAERHHEAAKNHHAAASHHEAGDHDKAKDHSKRRVSMAMPLWNTAKKGTKNPTSDDKVVRVQFLRGPLSLFSLIRL